MPARHHDSVIRGSKGRSVSRAMSTSASRSPRFKHDCDRCVFLGEHQAHDLYFCEACAGGPTVIARYGSEGKQYTSGLELAAVDPLLAEARERAVHRGLLSPRRGPGAS